MLQAPEVSALQRWTLGRRVSAFLFAVIVAVVAFFVIPWWNESSTAAKTHRLLAVLPAAAAAPLSADISVPDAAIVFFSKTPPIDEPTAAF